MKTSKTTSLLAGITVIFALQGCAPDADTNAGRTEVTPPESPSVTQRTDEAPAAPAPASPSTPANTTSAPTISEQEAYAKSAELMRAKFKNPNDLIVPDYSDSSSYKKIFKSGDGWVIWATFKYLGEPGYVSWDDGAVSMNRFDKKMWQSELEYDASSQNWVLTSLRVTDFGNDAIIR